MFTFKYRIPEVKGFLSKVKAIKDSIKPQQIELEITNEVPEPTALEVMQSVVDSNYVKEMNKRALRKQIRLNRYLTSKLQAS